MKDFSKKSTKKIVVWVLNWIDMGIDCLKVLFTMCYRAKILHRFKTGLVGLARGYRKLLGFS